jgi:hypothetical protein
VSWRRFNAARVVFYLALTPPAYFLGWLRSVTFVSLLSIWALVESGMATWRSDVPTLDEEEGG